MDTTFLDEYFNTWFTAGMIISLGRFANDKIVLIATKVLLPLTAFGAEHTRNLMKIMVN